MVIKKIKAEYLHDLKLIAILIKNLSYAVNKLFLDVDKLIIDLEKEKGVDHGNSNDGNKHNS